MQAWPGSMLLLPRVPPVQVELLVQVGAAPSGSGGGGGPASTGGAGTPPSVAQLPAGMPAATQAWKAPWSAPGTPAFGAGGIGEADDCMRASDLAPLLCAG
jgi:hypothetical protein